MRKKQKKGNPPLNKLSICRGRNRPFGLLETNEDLPTVPLAPQACVQTAAVAVVAVAEEDEPEQDAELLLLLLGTPSRAPHHTEGPVVREPSAENGAHDVPVEVEEVQLGVDVDCSTSSPSPQHPRFASSQLSDTSYGSNTTQSRDQSAPGIPLGYRCGRGKRSCRDGRRSPTG